MDTSCSAHILLCSLPMPKYMLLLLSVVCCLEESLKLKKTLNEITKKLCANKIHTAPSIRKNDTEAQFLQGAYLCPRCGGVP